MSTPLGSSQFFINEPVETGQSLRFEDSLSQYLSRTPASAGNRKTYTWSSWVKRGNLTSYMRLFQTTSTYSDSLILYNDDTIVFWGSDATTWNLQTNAVFRDVSAWYHIVVSVDTTQATASDRMKIYVNNELQTLSTATYPSQNTDCLINNTQAHYIGTNSASGQYLDGYLANVCFIDGQALTPTSFGEYKNTLWKPKSNAAIQALTFGTNGFYLNFADTTSLTTLGDDTSGNSNDWTLNSFSLNVAPSSDSPVLGGNFCTLDPNYSYPGLSYGNLLHYSATAGWTSAAGTFTVSSGKWYYEYMLSNVNNTTTFLMNGWAKTGSSNVVNNLHWYPGVTATSYGFFTTGQTYNNASAATYGSAQTDGDIVGVALDLDAGTLTYYINGVSQGTAFSGLSGEFFPAIGTYGGIALLNFGQDGLFSGNKVSQGNTDDNGVGDFYYAPPSGFLALKTSNLPAATITAPDEYFNTVLYTGSGADQSIGGVGFQPDFVWIKNRTFGTANNSYSHTLFDSVRGVGRDLNSNETSAESAFSASFSLTSFDNNGFSISDGGTLTNASGSTYVSWNWLAGGTSVLNQQGTIDSQVSANTDAGFSIMSFTSPATSSTAFTIGHGLSSAPEMIITKERDGTLGWLVYHDELVNPKDNYLLLNSSAGNSGTVTDCWGTSAPTSSVFGMKTSVSINPSKSTIAYCFHSVEGYSKIGSYTGSTSLPFVHCGFRPAWIMLKRTDDSGNWYVFDNKRSGYNVDNDSLSPDLTNSEYDGATYNFIDILSSGFKMRDTIAGRNASGGTYTFLAFAEAPFKLANAR